MDDSEIYSTNYAILIAPLRIIVIRTVTVPTSVSSSGSNLPRDLCRDCERRGILIPLRSIIRAEKNIAPSLFLSRPRSSPGE